MSGPGDTRRRRAGPERPADQGGRDPARRPAPNPVAGPGRHGSGPPPDPEPGEPERIDRRRPPGSSADSPTGPERLSDLLPRAARDLGLESQLELAMASAAWERIVARRVPAAAGHCRLRSIERGVAVVEADLPIVGQEIRLRSMELLRALRSAVPTPIASLQVVPRHV